jgi:hypothetical protein
MMGKRKPVETVATEACCASWGDWVMVPGDEDPENTLCVPCADALDNDDGLDDAGAE